MRKKKKERECKKEEKERKKKPISLQLTILFFSRKLIKCEKNKKNTKINKQNK